MDLCLMSAVTGQVLQELFQIRKVTARHNMIHCMIHEDAPDASETLEIWIYFLGEFDLVLRHFNATNAKEEVL